MLNQFVLYIFLWILDNGSFSKVNNRNRAKIEATIAFRKGNYREAANQYLILSKQSIFTPPEVSLNYAHALFEAKDTLAARQIYARLSGLKEAKLTSTTLVQLGLIFCNQQDTAKALTLFKQALVMMPENNIARFNYELLKRKFKPKQEPPKPPPPSSQKTPPKPPPQENAEVAKNENQQELLRTLKNYGLTVDKAKTILDAMKNSEIQYIQQRQKATKNPNKTITKQNW
ncbi:tetratricopeptide repeat protein [Arcicella rosea]|uniref:Tetratricopeptide (TPR) repeat protein n=1 Tax=Arcicella rosea TaxID=502909 RepID=A0A841ENW3_9BACT|nr:tetratricopeptide repeat protein [Arcicella rosea]MBB6003069.1 tetratricopeptide (TPR) repeat protein [Arcicella rosea]